MEGKTMPAVNGLGMQSGGAGSGFHHHLPQIPTMGRNMKIAQSKASAKNVTSPEKDEVGFVRVESATEATEPDDHISNSKVKTEEQSKTESKAKNENSSGEEKVSTAGEEESEMASECVSKPETESTEISVPTRVKRQAKRKFSKDELEVAEKIPKSLKSQNFTKTPSGKSGGAAPKKADTTSGESGGTELPEKVGATPPGKVGATPPGKPGATPPGKAGATLPGKAGAVPPGKAGATPSGKGKSAGNADATKPPKWLVGDLLWAKVSGHPWWPCMVSYDPYIGIYTRVKGERLLSRSYHVQFFGDEAERGWIFETSTIPFQGKDKFFRRAEDLIENAPKKEKNKVCQLYKVNATRRVAWEIGVRGAEEALPLDRNERKQKYTFVYDIPDKKDTSLSKKRDSSISGRRKSGKDLPNGMVSAKRGRKRKQPASEPDVQSTPKKRKTDQTEIAKSPTVPHKHVKYEGSFESFYQKHCEGVLEEHPDYDRDAVEEYLHQQWCMMTEEQKARYTSKYGADGKEKPCGSMGTKRSPRISRPSIKKIEAEEGNKLFSEILGKRQKRGQPPSQSTPSPDAKPDVQKGKESATKLKQNVVEVKPVALKAKKTEGVDPDAADIENTICSVADGAGVIPGVEPGAEGKKKRRHQRLVSVDSQSQSSDSGSETQGEVRPVMRRVKVLDEEYEQEILKLNGVGPPKRESICQICEQIGELVECQGPCQGYFHSGCLGINAQPAGEFKCDECQSGVHTCFACKESGRDVKRCSVSQCGRFYHEECVKKYPQTRFEGKGFFCPLHVCATCFAENNKNPKATKGRLLRCVRCPVAYHVGDYCVAAGSSNLAGYHIVCSNHFKPNRSQSHHSHVNVSWCFMCSKGGTLLCCESCPAAFHAECLKIDFPEGSWYCHDCKSGKKPLYGDIIWVKLGNYRWWPGEICHPRNVPTNIQEKPHQVGEFPVRFFGSHDFFWIYQGRVFLFQDGDKGSKESATAKGLAKIFSKGVQEATEAFKVWKAAKENKEQQEQEKCEKKPAPFKFVKTNIPVGNVQIYKADLSEIARCECQPDQENPCSSDTECLNRMLMYECHPSTCPAGEKCQNQRFQKRQYPDSVSFKTASRGWGLKTLVSVKKGQFVNEYVGDLVDEEECRRRIKKAHEENITNFYMLTLDKNRVIDAGPKGNLSRFMNHCCQPNCETQKWTVNGDIRVGLFALCDITAGSELTFNYNLDCLGNDKRTCSCGAPNCSGFLGVRPKTAAAVANEKRMKDSKKKKKKRKPDQKKEHEDDCFRCGEGGELVMCDKSSCPKVYHLQCLNLTKPPHGKWLCPWHHCDVCGKPANKLCTECPNSFCNQHIEGNIYNVEGFLVCSDHESLLEGKTFGDVDSASETSASESNADSAEGKPVDEKLDKSALTESAKKPEASLTQEKSEISGPSKNTDIAEVAKLVGTPSPLQKVPGLQKKVETKQEKRKVTVVNSARKANIKSRPLTENTLLKETTNSKGKVANKVEKPKSGRGRGRPPKSGVKNNGSGTSEGPLPVANLSAGALPVAPLFDDSDEDEFSDLVIDIPPF